MPHIEVDRADTNREWDTWVATVPGGHHLQTSGWAAVKALAGWRAVRLLMRNRDQLVGGCQILMRQVPLARHIAYVPRGPLLALRNPELLDEMLARIRRFAREEHVLMLKVQPPVDRKDVPALLREQGFVRSDLNTAPAASVRVVLDRTRGESELLGAMRGGTRRNVQTAIKRGVTVRRGDVDDLGVLQAILEATAVRQGFDPYPPTYYRRLWTAFGETGQARLLLAEYEGAPVSVALLIAFGDTVLYKIGGWSGAPAPGANELMHFTGLCLARQEGFRYYDFEGIPTEIAQTVLNGGKAPTSGVPFFKLGFGGEVVLYPEAHDAYFGRVVGRLTRRILPYAERSGSMVHRIVGRAA